MTVKSVAITTTLISAVALGIIVHQYEENRSAASAVSALSAAQTRDRALIKDLEWRLAAAKERELKTELDHAPQTAVAAGAPSNAAPNAGPQPITRDQLEARLENARNLAQSGRYGEALSEYLWCYDTGTRQVEGYFMTRYSTLLQSLADLGRTYPAALDALRARRDAAKVRLLASATDMEAGKDFGQINRVLGEDSATQALFDALAEDDPRRGHIVESSIGRLLAAQRYHELAQAMPYSGWPQAWEEMTQSARAPAPNEAQALARRSDMIGVAAGQIEMRAGAGQLIEAGDAIERVLIFDSSPGTVSLLQEHLRRAGHPELLKL